MQTTPKIGFWLDNSNQTPQQTVFIYTLSADEITPALHVVPSKLTSLKNKKPYPFGTEHS